MCLRFLGLLYSIYTEESYLMVYPQTDSFLRKTGLTGETCPFLFFLPVILLVQLMFSLDVHISKCFKFAKSLKLSCLITLNISLVKILMGYSDSLSMFDPFIYIYLKSPCVRHMAACNYSYIYIGLKFSLSFY